MSTAPVAPWMSLPLSEVSALMDNVIHLRYVEMGGALQRLIAVLKVRSRGHDHALRELHIAGSGMRVGRPIDGAGMTLTGLGLPR